MSRHFGDVDDGTARILSDSGSTALAVAARRHRLRVSVIMPTWNRGHVIEKAVDSVWSQTVQPYELIVVDDGSTDDTQDRLRTRYATELHSGKLKIVESGHGGVCAARNAGLRRATGDIIAYLDSDNQWHDHYVAMMVCAFGEDEHVSTAYAALMSYNDGEPAFVRASPYRRDRLLDANYIDLNIFAHRSDVYRQLGGFDESLTRLVDWDLILRYTRCYPPVYLPVQSVDYHLNESELANITFTDSLDDNQRAIHRKFARERAQFGREELRIAYVAWDWPALSQTFFHREVRMLVDEGFDVHVYWHVPPEASVDQVPQVPNFQVESSEHLAQLLVEHDRNICHSHFIYPATSLLAYEACVSADVDFTFMPHAVDLFHVDAPSRNRLAEVANHPLCRRVFVYGDFHAAFLTEQGVDPLKITYTMQAVDLEVDPSIFDRIALDFGTPPQALVIARFIEKKGIGLLLDALSQIPPSDLLVKIVGYGPLGDQLRAQAAALNLANVEFVGPVTSEDELAALYRDTDFLLVPAVVASNGDMDGFPTVILEAMSIGVPVLTSDVSAIPDYVSDEVEAIVVQSGDCDSLVDGIRRMLGSTPEERATLARNAAAFVADRVGTRRTLQTLLDQWQHYTIDIVLVTFDRDGYRSPAETQELINRVKELTTTPYHLIVVDNNSDPSFVNKLRDWTSDIPLVTVIAKETNDFCGPASNIAIRSGWSEIMVYLCSKEAFPLRRGWERSFINHIRDNENSVLAGHLAVTPGCVTGSEYLRREDFAKFRKPEFAADNESRSFRHVQGGLYGARRSFLREIGGFNEQIPHNGMDIELSYVAEATGNELGVVPDIVSLTDKTLPKPIAHLDRRSSAVHPLTVDELAGFAHLRSRFTRACNHCGWVGDTRDGSILTRRYRQLGCPRCASSGLARMLLRELANHALVHSGAEMMIVSFDDSPVHILGERMFRCARVEPFPELVSAALAQIVDDRAVFVVDGSMNIDHGLARRYLQQAADTMQPGSLLVGPWGAVQTLPPAHELTLADEALQFGLIRYGKKQL